MKIRFFLAALVLLAATEPGLDYPDPTELRIRARVAQFLCASGIDDENPG